MFLFIDKPKGITSHDAVNRIRKISGEKRVGHAGTLDPNATGLLIVGIGRESTKKLWTKFGKMDKTYIAEITLGEERVGEDSTGKVLTSNFKSPKNTLFSKSLLTNVLKSFIGKKMQIPPSHSAIKVGGKPAYKIARKGHIIQLKPRPVNIYSIKLLKYKYPVVEIQVKVSSGTYIRALARDFGRKIGCGAYLSNLRRIKIGKYTLKDALLFDEINPETFSKYFKN